MTLCFLRGASVIGPGFSGWPAASAILRGEVAWCCEMPAVPPPAMLSANERRRSGLATRLALAVCNEAAARSCLEPAALAGVFASSNGEGSIVHGLLETLSGPDRKLSPTAFHNSVHNAVAGYWSIGNGSMQPVTCLACHDETFGTALLQAACGVAAGRDVLLCVYDAPIPAPLGDRRPTAFGFASAYVLSPSPGDAPMAQLRLEARFGAAGATDLPRNAALAALLTDSGAARALRLLESLARNEADIFTIGLTTGSLAVEIQPC